MKREVFPKGVTSRSAFRCRLCDVSRSQTFSLAAEICPALINYWSKYRKPGSRLCFLGNYPR